MSGVDYDMLGEFEVQARMVPGTDPWLELRHKACGADVTPVDWSELDLEVACSFAVNHLKACQKRVLR